MPITSLTSYFNTSSFGDTNASTRNQKELSLTLDSAARQLADFKGLALMSAGGGAFEVGKLLATTFFSAVPVLSAIPLLTRSFTFVSGVTADTAFTTFLSQIFGEAGENDIPFWQQVLDQGSVRGMGLLGAGQGFAVMQLLTGLASLSGGVLCEKEAKPEQGGMLGSMIQGLRCYFGSGAFGYWSGGVLGAVEQRISLKTRNMNNVGANLVFAQNKGRSQGSPLRDLGNRASKILGIKTDLVPERGILEGNIPEPLKNRNSQMSQGVDPDAARPSQLPTLPAPPDEEGFWREQLGERGPAHAFFKSDFERMRLFRAFEAATQEVGAEPLSRKNFLNLLLDQLRLSRGSAGRVYATRYGVEEALRGLETELLSHLRTRAGVEIAEGPFSRALKKYPVDLQGGIEWGVRVKGARPQAALQEALGLLPTTADGKLIEAEVEGLSFQARLARAREILAQAQVRVLAVWGAGRHGLALGDWIRQAAGESEEIGGKNVIPVMLGHSPDFAAELNIDGTYEKALPGIPINNQDRLGLRAASPHRNQAYLALADTVVTTLPSTALEKIFTPEMIRLLAPNTQIIPAIKSLLNGGRSVPFYFYRALAVEGRFDLMLCLALQSGLGFPKEMVGDPAPEAPVNLAIDCISIEAGIRAARVLMGDEALIARVSEDRVILEALNKRIDVGRDVFTSAFGGWIKNTLAPWVSHQVADFLVTTWPRVSVAALRGKSSELQGKAIKLIPEVFDQHERQAIQREVRDLLKIVRRASDAPSVFEAERKQVEEWLSKLDSQGPSSPINHHYSIVEDLLGCTRIRDMEVFLRIVGDLINPTVGGLIFQRRETELTMRVRSQASSANAGYGLLDRIWVHLVEQGRLVRRPKPAFTAEGINAVPHIRERWGEVPVFVEEVLAWVHPAEEPIGKPALHRTGMRYSAFDVARDYIFKIDNKLFFFDQAPLSSDPVVLRKDTLNILKLGRQMIDFLRQDTQADHFPLLEEAATRLGVTLTDFEQLLMAAEGRIQRLDFTEGRTLEQLHLVLPPFRKILHHLRSQFDSTEDLTHWENRRTDIQAHMTEILDLLNPPS